MINLSIVFPVFNNLEYTKRCLQYLKENLVPIDKVDFRTSIVVVDDGSKDGTFAWIRTNHPDVHVCQGDGNLWWSGGINLGIRYAIDVLHTEYILLWNNDIRPATNYFTHLFDILSTNNIDNIVLSKIYAEHSSEKIIFSLGGNFNPITGKHALIGIGKRDGSKDIPNLEINWFPGMGTTIHVSVFNRIGFFDNVNFPQYKGDADFGLRAKKAGYKLTLFPQLEIWNDRENTGYSNTKSLRVFLKSLTSIKSNANIHRDILFYRRHSKSFRAYFELLNKYYTHIGGFFKWKFLGLFGLQRKRLKKQP